MQHCAGKGLHRARRSTVVQGMSESSSLLSQGALASIDASDVAKELRVSFDNDIDEKHTVVTVEGSDQANLLITLSGAFGSCGLDVISAVITSDDGRVCDVFKVLKDDKKVPVSAFPEIRMQLDELTSTSSRSSRPAIYGIVAAAEVERLRPLSGAGMADEVATLELAAAEMAQAAAELVATEREILRLRQKGAEAKELGAREALRTETAALLERRMGAMEAVMAARRTALVETTKAEPTAAEKIMQLMTPPEMGAMAVGGAAAGSGYEILFQGYNWESHKHNWYKTLTAQIPELGRAGVTAIWLPPPSDSVSPQGYLPRDLYKMDTAYGSEAELRTLIGAMHENGIKAIADIVLNHRCASYQGPDKKWNKFGGRLAWDASAITCSNPAWGGRGNPKRGEEYAAAPNIDHTQESIRADYTAWLKWLRNSIGFDGWRLDFVRGFPGQTLKGYIDETVPAMAFGEFWDSCEYTDGVLNYNQDAHRQRIVNWCDTTGGTSGAFDFTSKGILQEAVQRREYWRLVDAQGRPAGFMGMWPSRAITFIDNHDTGSTLNHWPFPTQHLPLGYAYILTHPGTPTVFYDHYYQEANGLRKAIMDLMAIRKRHGINCRSKVTVRKATADVYAATIDDKIAMKIGPGDWAPSHSSLKLNGKDLKIAATGNQFAVWEV
ncbi:hypothetical protein FOA52_004327 [Chlamydomonas sp. UWO 241]|nr:hypothetical protein FOA52_004327 [Chlamydomonas sp. UWO 241]